MKISNFPSGEFGIFLCLTEYTSKRYIPFYLEAILILYGSEFIAKVFIF